MGSFAQGVTSKYKIYFFDKLERLFVAIFDIEDV